VVDYESGRSGYILFIDAFACGCVVTAAATPTFLLLAIHAAEFSMTIDERNVIFLN